MVKFIIVLIFVFLSACCGKHSEIKYKYKDIIITRKDECGVTSFYYDDGEDEAYGKIWIEYSGINDGFNGYLVFHTDGRVSIFSGDGNFKSNSLDTARLHYKRILAHERPEVSDSVYYITLSTRYEKENNREGRTGIKARYEVDDSH